MRRLALWILLASSASLCRADDPSPRIHPLPSDPVYDAVRIDGSTTAGRIRQLGDGNAVVLVADGKETVIPLAQLLKLTRVGEPPDAPPGGSLVLFPDGDRMRAQIASATETALEIAPNILGDTSISVPLDAPLGLILAPSAQPDIQEAAIGRLRDEPRKSAVLILANGDRQTGDFLGLSATKVTLGREGGPAEFDRSGVTLVGFDPALISYPRPPGQYLELMFRDGSRIGVNSCRIEGGKIVATTRFGVKITPAVADLARVHVRSDAIEYLADRKEALAEFVGYIGPHRGSMARDHAVDGRRLRLGGQPYDRGLGMASRSLIAYRLSPKDLRFQATVGLDDRAGPLGSVVFRVLVNGKEEKFASPPLTRRDPPMTVDVDLQGARLLVLVVEFGERGDVQDMADWAEARIIRRPD